MTDTAVDIRSVRKVFNAGSAHPVTALDGVSLNILDNEFFTLLGPSGCGKTTLLRLIAGFEQASEGEILLFGQRIERLSPHERPVNTVFQQYALFPHMTVFDNVAFGLEMLGKSKSEISSRVGQMLELVKMPEFASRKPAQLSGGQQQRIALARALAPHPKVLLLDEPLSALDLKLRHAMRSELKTLQRETGVTFIFVTHDQEEALTMSDRIAVMSNGLVQQVGSPTEIYELPVNRFVADFIGRSNFLEGQIAGMSGSKVEVEVAGSRLELETSDRHSVGERVTLVLRPEKIALKAQLNGGINGKILDTMYLGTDTSYTVKLEAGPELEVRDQNGLMGSARFKVGDAVSLDIAPNAARVIQG
ncbi:MAG: ABC transporter ATP-binding protein [Trueperaceae bacterium]|nr:ABC transporter ATP-binding protein [Trueperaceae bacterium]